MSLVARVEIELIWKPKIRGSLSNELVSDHTDDEVRLAVKLNVCSDNVGVSGETTLPQPIAEHRHAAAIGAVFCSREGTARHQWSAEQTKIVACDMDSLQLFRIVATGQVESGAGLVIARNGLKDTRLLTPDVELGNVGAGRRSLRACVCEHH